MVKVKVRVVFLESRLHDNACSADFTFPLARWTPMQPATIEPTLDLCTRYPLRLGRPRQCGIRSLPDTSTYGQHWDSNPRPSDLESNALSTGPHALYIWKYTYTGPQLRLMHKPSCLQILHSFYTLSAHSPQSTFNGTFKEFYVWFHCSPFFHQTFHLLPWDLMMH